MTPVQSVVRSLTLLAQVAHLPRGLVGLAEAAELPTSTAARLLATLEDAGAVVRDEEGIYRIGRTIADLAAAGDLEPSLRTLAHPYMVELVAVVDEAVGLSIPIDNTTVTIAQVDTPRAVQAEDWFGTRWPLVGGGSGYALMSTWSEPEIDRVLRGVPDGEQIRAAIDAVRHAGVSWSRGDYVDELSSVAAPILDATDRAVGVLYIYGPSYRFPPPGAVGEVEHVLIELADRVSKAWIARTTGRGGR